ncbi:universal stress protein [Methylococcus geothermalis]|uniref:Universal stress protein n=1 Tax=Methylococcus geothermalis TaxID=2681310 RepID=A0A858Q8H7_9GAMM|nr:universal stress protein [Methylococcus geothermalis]QJD30202.1 universal stress protein [Methylococcus geothermalis]
MKLLVAIDFSDLTDKVLAQAKLLARALSAEIWLLHVAEPEPDFVGYDADPLVMRDLTAETYKIWHRRIQEAAEALRAEGLNCTGLMVQGPTVDTILKEAERLQADMIVLGSHSKGLLARLVVGSTCEGVLRGTSVPVLMVPV